MEVSGLALSLVPVFTQTLKIYASLLNMNHGNQFETIRLRILTERARFESFVQLFSRIEKSHDPRLEELVSKVTDQINFEFAKLERLKFMQSSGGPGKSLTAVRLRWAFVESEKAREIVDNLTVLNNGLLGLLPYVNSPENFPSQSYQSSSSTQQESSISEYVSSSVLASKSSIPEERNKPDHANDGSKGWSEEPSFRTLVRACQDCLRLISPLSEGLKEIYLSYWLWSHALKVENVYAIFVSYPKSLDEDRGPDVLKLHYQILVNLAWILLQSTATMNITSIPSGSDISSRLEYAMIKAYEDSAGEACDDITDLTEVDESAPTMSKFLVEEMRILTESLTSCLPLLLHLTWTARAESDFENIMTSQALQVKSDEDQGIGQLLDLSIQMTEPISADLDLLEHSEDPEHDNLTMKSIKAVFDREVDILRKWKESYGSNIEEHLSSRNPAKLEAIAESVYIITNLLYTFPGPSKMSVKWDADFSQRIDKLLGERASKYPQLQLGAVKNTPQSAVEALKACVQTLTALEIPIDLVEPPPAYEKETGDKIVLDMDGRVIEVA